MSGAVRILILGTGGMAQKHADAYAAMPDVQVVAACDPRAHVRAAFCAKNGIGSGFATLDEALAWGAFDAASNVTPDAAHHATTLLLLAAGKAVLCEKPLAPSEADARAMVAAAEAAGVVAMVNLSYRDGPAMQAAAAMVRAGEIGEVRHLEASYLQSWLTQPAWGDWRTDPQWLWRLSTAHGSNGVLGDVGVHILDFATHVAGLEVAEVSCRLATYHKAAGGRVGDYTLDANDSAVMQVVLSNGALGSITTTRFASGHLNDLSLRLFGTTGGLEVGFTRGVSTLRACTGADLASATWRDIDCPPVPGIYARFIAAVRKQGMAEPDFARGAALQAVLDRAVQSAQQSGRSLKV